MNSNKAIGVKLVCPDMMSGSHGYPGKRVRFSVGKTYTKKRRHNGPPRTCTQDGFHFYQYLSHAHPHSPVVLDACVMLAVSVNDYARAERKSVARELRVDKAIAVGTRCALFWIRLHAAKKTDGWSKSAASSFMRDPSLKRLQAMRRSQHPVDRSIVAAQQEQGGARTVQAAHAAPPMPKRMNKLMLQHVYHPGLHIKACLHRLEILHGK